MKPIVFCASLPQEVKPLCHRLGIPVPRPGSWFSEGVTQSGYAVQVIVSGVGRERMKKRLLSMPARSVNCWVSLGFAGGLSSPLSAGDCIIGHRILSSIGSRLSSCVESESSDLLYCSDSAICTPREKQKLFLQTGALAVDMESAAVAEHAMRREEPFVWIRVISDTVEESVPQALFQCFSPDGFPSIYNSCKVLLKYPWLTHSLIRMGFRSERGASRLAESVLPWLLLFHSPAYS